MQRLKRGLTLFGLTAALFIFMAGLTSCGLADTASEGLSNAIGSENGPGSGKWKPSKPLNKLQARQLHTALTSLSNKGNEFSIAYDKLYEQCFDIKGNLLPGSDAERCLSESSKLATEIRSYFRDFYVGLSVYGEWVQENEEEEDPPKPPDPPKEPKNDPPPDTEAPGDNDNDDDDDWGWRCLTCTNRIDIEYMYAPFRVTVQLN